MRPSYFLVCALLSPAVIGCSDSLPPPPVVTPPAPTTVHIKSEVKPLLVAYRDGFTDEKGVLLPWKSAPLSTDIMLDIGGAYSVTVVCMTETGVLTWQASHTVDDDRPDDKTGPTLQTPCNSPGPALSAVDGTLVKAGAVHLGDADSGPLAASGGFTLRVADNMYDLVASDPGDKKALIRRGVMVNGTTHLNNVNVDTDADSVSLTAVSALTLDNPPPAPDPTDPMDTHTETVQATVEVATANNATPGQVHVSVFDLSAKTNKDKKASAFAYPSAMLTADDAQSATFIGTNHPMDTQITTTRMQTRPLTANAMSGMTTFQLPPLISRPGWGLDPQNRLSVALPGLPALDDLTVSTSATNGGNTYQISITANFFTATSLARPVFDTDLSGSGLSFSAAWKIDFSKAYTRDIVSQHDVTNKAGDVIGHETSMFHEDVPAP